MGKSKAAKSTFTAVRRDPKAVGLALKQYRRNLCCDIEDVRMRRPIAAHSLPFHPEFKTISDYLRSRLLNPANAHLNLPKDGTAAAWHPFILDFCKTLGLNAGAVDRLFRRIISGDLGDERAFESDVNAGLEQLDAAIDLARQQWLAKEPAIKGPGLTLKGVSLQDAALVLNEDDGSLVPPTVKRWRNSGAPKLPAPIGIDPEHSQRRLFDLPALLKFLGDIEGIVKSKECGRALKDRLRVPRE